MALSFWFRSALVSSAVIFLCAIEGSASSEPDDVMKISVSPATVSSGDWVTVTYNSVPSEELLRPATEYICKQDSYCEDVEGLSLWVGVFEKGANRTAIGPQHYGSAPWLATHPVKWKPVNATDGDVSFKMQSSRASEIEFVLFSNGTSWPIQLAVSNPLRYDNANKPQHLHLARTTSQSEMRVSWSSVAAEEGALVRWGTAPGTYEHNASATSSTYGPELLCGPPATSEGWLSAPFFHTAVLRLLPTAPARVYYSAGSDTNGWTTERSFEVPAPPAANASLHVLALADLGESYEDGSQYHLMEPFAINTTAFALNRWGNVPGLHSESGKVGRGRIMQSLGSTADVHDDAPVELVLHIGDLSYATGYASEWDRFMTQIEPLASRAPYMTGQGNHERDYPNSGSFFGGVDSGGECGVPTQQRFIMPVPGTQDEGWYSFDQGPAHFVMMNTEMSSAAGSAQLSFLTADLAAVDRSVTPWVIVQGHRAMYSSSDTLHPSAVYDLDNGPWWPEVEAVLVEHEVDLCLWGHVHNAEQTCPLVNGTCKEPASPGGYDAPVHAVIGNAGQSLSPWCLSSGCCCGSTGPLCQEACDSIPSWSKWRLDQFGFSTLEIEGATSLTVNFFVDCIGQRDATTMYKCTSFNELVHSFTIERRADLRAKVMLV